MKARRGRRGNSNGRGRADDSSATARSAALLQGSPLGGNRLAIIGGSAAYDLLREGGIAGTELGPIATPFGPSAIVRELPTLEGAEPVLFLSRHGERGYGVTAPYVNYRANVYAVKSLGAGHILAWSGPGAVDDSLAIGQYVVPDDLIDMTRGRAGTFYENRGVGFIRQNPVFCPELRRMLLAASEAVGSPARDGATYICTQGPRLETPAEIRMFGQWGAHLVGMTLIPEAFLARELAMGYAAVCYVVNYAEGIRERPYRPGVRFEGMVTPEEDAAVKAAVRRFPELIREVARLYASSNLACRCHTSMDRFIASGRVDADWRKWVEPE